MLKGVVSKEQGKHTEQHLYPTRYVYPSIPADQVEIEDASPTNSVGHETKGGRA